LGETGARRAQPEHDREGASLSSCLASLFTFAIRTEIGARGQDAVATARTFGGVHVALSSVSLLMDAHRAPKRAANLCVSCYRSMARMVTPG
jgi:hypothetical protein